MRHFAITGIDTAAMISGIFFGEAMRATPPSARICAGTRSSAITATAPAFSAITACSAFVTSMTTPPFSISAKPVFRRRLVELPLFWDMLWIPFGLSCRHSAVSFQANLFASAKDRRMTHIYPLRSILQGIHHSRYPAFSRRRLRLRGENSLRACRPLRRMGIPSASLRAGSSTPQLVRVSRPSYSAQDDKILALHILFEHFFGVDGDENATAASQDFIFLVEDFGGIDVGASTIADFVAFYAQRFVQRDRLQVFDRHF